MQRCQYIRESDLPPLASAAEIAQTRAACDQRATASLGYSAKQSITRWRLPEVQLRSAVIRHINTGKRMFHTYSDDGTGNLIPGHVQANVTLSGGPDIYVEVVLMQNSMIIIYAHDHTPGKSRLPQ